LGDLAIGVRRSSADGKTHLCLRQELMDSWGAPSRRKQ
jgi:hypothetical protein